MAVLNYAQLTDVKTYLWISWSGEDTSLSALLLQSYYLLNNMLWVDTLNQTTKTEVITRIYNDGTFWVKNWPTTALLTVDWESYTWVLNTDYQIIRKRQLIVKDISDYMTDLEFNNVTITYTAWYDRDETGTTPWWGDTLPDDIKLMQMMLIGWLRSQAGNEWVSEYKLWEENIKYWTASWVVESKDVPTFNNLLSMYKVQDVKSI